jgi:hypothetical protein
MAQVSSSRALILGTETPNQLTPVAGVTTGQSSAILRDQDGVLSFYVRGIGTITGGTLIIEEADWNQFIDVDYTGTWSQIQSVTLSTLSGGAQLSIHITDSSYGFVRARISSTVTGGGSITVAVRSRGAL